jgi:hypothetical protein
MTQSHECRAYLEELRGSSYFVETPPFANYYDLNAQLSGGTIEAAIEIPPGFGRNIERRRPAWVTAWIDGARPFIAQTIRGYLEAMHHQVYLADRCADWRGIPRPCSVALPQDQCRDDVIHRLESAYAATATITSI